MDGDHEENETHPEPSAEYLRDLGIVNGIESRSGVTYKEIDGHLIAYKGVVTVGVVANRWRVEEGLPRRITYSDTGVPAHGQTHRIWVRTTG